MKSTQAMRDRARELMKGERDDYDRVFEIVLDELEDLLRTHKKTEEEILATAIDRMGWPEIHAFQDELRRGQDIYEDAGGFMMRAIRRLFGLPSPYSEIETYQQAARRMVAEAEAGR